MSWSPDYYAVLGIHPDAEDEVVTAAYKALAKKYHPDSGSEAASSTRFMQVQDAYEVLKDQQRRKAYDRERAAWNTVPPINSLEDRQGPAHPESDSKVDAQSAATVTTSKKHPWGFTLLVGALVIASAALVAEIAQSLRFIPSTIPESNEASGTPPVSETSVKGSLPGAQDVDQRLQELSVDTALRRKQIYDRIVGETEESDSPPTGPPTAKLPIDARGPESGGEVIVTKTPDLNPVGQ